MTTTATPTTLTPAAEAYLQRVRKALADLPEDEQEEILGDVAVQLADLAPSTDTDLEAALGSPEDFAGELREAAGMGTRPAPDGLWSALGRRLDEFRNRPAMRWWMAQWVRLRPYWLATRGWLLVASISVIYNRDPFVRFPLPEVLDEAWVGGAVVAASTWLSFRLARSPRRGRFVDVAFTVATLFYVSITLSGAFPLTQSLDEPHGGASYRGLLGTDGPITNLYPYDLDGNPTQVLLYDQEGRPVLTRPELRSGGYEPLVSDGKLIIPEDGGAIAIPLDENGRPIPNLYPQEERPSPYRGGQPTIPTTTIWQP